MSSGRVIQCKYSCKGCGIEKRIISVAERVAEPIVEWIEQILTPAIAADHARYSPACTSVVCDLMIPLADAHGNEASRIGGLPPEAS